MNPKSAEDLDLNAVIQILQSETSELTSLSPKQKELYERAQKTYDLIQQWKSRKKVVPMLMKEFSITLEHAYVLYNHTQIIFGDASKNNKSFFVEILIEQIFEVYRLAQTTNNLKEMNAANKQLHAAIKDFFPETDALLPEDINVPAIFMGFYPDELGMKLPTEVEIQKRVSRILEFKKKKKTEYTDFEEIETDD